ncbi:hypothetical protein Raf01_41160 [Rugosimonospora africana]|uniref:Transcriptional regulator n=2 Tax=Rugosimonospora africana TaxID=556532 RepID=A0A8J3QT33_9ACTN|nr:hypothetical protein Raf01_41160 [Rugosimonospora africana]
MEQRRGYGDLGQEILTMIGRAGTPMTPAQARDTLYRQLAYTTVMTVMARLHDQGLLTRKRAGRALAYTILGDPAMVTAQRMRRLLDIDQDRAEVLARFVAGLNADDERLLRGLLHRITAGRGNSTSADGHGSCTGEQP